MKIGMTLSRTDLDAPLAEHFGKAKWLLFLEAPDRFEFVRNAGLNGRHVAEAFAARRCTDVIVRHLGPGAFAHVTAAGMRVWQGEANQTARMLAQTLEQGALLPFAPDGDDHGHAHHGHAHQAARGNGH